MSGILPNNGVVPSRTQNGIANPELAGDCENLYYPPRCNPRLDPFAMNALISEIINALNAIGIPYDCSRTDNLATAFQLLSNPIAQPTGAPAAILQHRLPSGTQPGIVTSINGWVTRPLNIKRYDPANLVSLNSDLFTPAVDMFITWDNVFSEASEAKSRLYNVTDGLVTDVGLSTRAGDLPAYDDTTSNSRGSAFIEGGKTYRIECRTSSVDEFDPGSALGTANNFGVDELYASVQFWRAN